jgi:hypothetical protein
MILNKNIRIISILSITLLISIFAITQAFAFITPNQTAIFPQECGYGEGIYGNGLYGQQCDLSPTTILTPTTTVSSKPSSIATPTITPTGIEDSPTSPPSSTPSIIVTSGEPSLKSYTLEVKIVDKNNFPISGAEVFIPSLSKTVKTDENGVAIFTNISPGEIKIEVLNEGQKTEKTIAISGSSEKFTITIVLDKQSNFPWWILLLIILTILLAIYIWRREKRKRREAELRRTFY